MALLTGLLAATHLLKKEVCGNSPSYFSVSYHPAGAKNHLASRQQQTCCLIGQPVFTIRPPADGLDRFRMTHSPMRDFPTEYWHARPYSMAWSDLQSIFPQPRARNKKQTVASHVTHVTWVKIYFTLYLRNRRGTNAVSLLNAQKELFVATSVRVFVH